MPEVNKVVYYGDTLIDLTNDTAEPADVVAGKYFHLANGERASGTANYAPLNHTHDDRYYTETETDTLLNGLENDIFDFKRYRTLTSSDNLNNLDQENSSGVYHLNNVIPLIDTNAPIAYGLLYNVRLNSTNVFQFVIGGYGYNCYSRYKVGSTWINWRKMIGINNLNPLIQFVEENNEMGFVISSDLFS